MNENMKITQQGFLRIFIDRNSNRPEKPFCFVLGAGASRSSGLLTGGELAKDWIKEVWEENNIDNLTFDAWIKKQMPELQEFTIDRFGEKYSEIYELRFGEQPEDGIAFLEKIMEPIKPSYGYSVLAYLLSETPHKVVITTNFDNLVANALFLHSKTFPRIVGHDLLAEYVIPEVRRPLIAKIHGDLGFPTKSTPEEIACLSKQWTKALEGIFKRYTPIWVFLKSCL
jgi:NAD-dependent SIR2 family protein deacetylase